MNKQIKFAAVALALAGTAAIAAPEAMASTTVLILGGTGAGTLTDAQMGATLDGIYDADTLVNVSYPAAGWPVTGLTDPTLGTSIDKGVANLNAEIAAEPAGQQIVVVGSSQGAMVIDEEEEELAAEPNAPPPSSITFVAIADPNRPLGVLGSLTGVYIPILNYTAPGAPDTVYNTEVIAQQYDGFSDFPTNPLNLLADANALAGSIYLHAPTTDDDLSTVPAADITTTTNSAGGVTTTYVVPTATLPLLTPLVQIGVPAPVVAAINAELKPIVDAGYAPISQQTTTRETTANDAVRNSATVSDRIVNQGARALRASHNAGGDRPAGTGQAGAAVKAGHHTHTLRHEKGH